MCEVGFIEVDEILESFTCRCCLTQSEESMDNIFECHLESVPLQEILSVIAPVSIFAEDGFYQSICETCKTNAFNAYFFRQTCIASDEKLRTELAEEVVSVEEQEAEKLVPNDFKSVVNEALLSEEEEESEEGNEFECVYCGESFESSDEMSKHVLGNHRAEVEEILNEESFECWTCGKSFKSQVILDAHQKSHATNVTKSSSRKHGCDICLKWFETPSKLVRHMNVHRDILDPEDLPAPRSKDFRYSCHVCNKAVETPSKLERHLRVHKTTEKLFTGINQHRPHQCSLCDLRFWDEVKLKRHQVLHSDDFKLSTIDHPPGYMFTCVICLTQINEYEECISHMKSHREEFGENSEIPCKLCDKVYPKIASLVRHARMHDENATHECVHCKKKMGIGDDLIDHLLRHQGFKPFECKICQKKFMKSHKLKQHMVTHEDSSTNPYQCEICLKSYAGAEYLKRHLLRHSGRKDHVCTICAAKFTFKSGLTAHMETHSPKGRISCEICGATFTKKNSLKVHHLTHTGEKRFGCSQCDMAFTGTSHLKRHMLTHTGIRPYACTYCSKSYTQSNDLMKHLKVHLGPNVYRCDREGCQEAFAKYFELKKHKTSHYNELIAEDEAFLDEGEEGIKMI